MTPARWLLLETLRRENEMTIFEIAKKLKRHYKNVHSDVSRLSALGLIEEKRRWNSFCRAGFNFCGASIGGVND
jgi:predicted transcriptional regulator